MRLPLTLTPRPSRSLAASALVGHVAAAVAVLPLVLPFWVKLAALLGLVLSAFAVLIRLRRRLPALLGFGSDGAIRIEWRDGELFDARATADTAVLPWLVVLAVEDGARRRLLLPLAADSFAAGEFRDLRLWLRWCSDRRPAADS